MNLLRFFCNSVNTPESELLSSNSGILKKQSLTNEDKSSENMSEFKDSKKKTVRFSQEFNTSFINGDDNEIFFEAQDSFPIDNMHADNHFSIHEKNENNDKENSNIFANSSNKNENDNDNKITVKSCVSSSSSLKVLMLLMVEQTDKTISTQDLQSLINSGLQQLDIKNLEKKLHVADDEGKITYMIKIDKFIQSLNYLLPNNTKSLL